MKRVVQCLFIRAADGSVPFFVQSLIENNARHQYIVLRYGLRLETKKIGLTPIFLKHCYHDTRIPCLHILFNLSLIEHYLYFAPFISDLKAKQS